MKKDYCEESYQRFRAKFPNISHIKFIVKRGDLAASEAKEWLSLPYVKSIEYNDKSNTVFQTKGLEISLDLNSVVFYEDDKIVFDDLNNSFQIRKTDTFEIDDLDAIFQYSETQQCQLIIDLKWMTYLQLSSSFDGNHFSKYLKGNLKITIIKDKDAEHIIQSIKEISHKVHIDISASQIMINKTNYHNFIEALVNQKNWTTDICLHAHFFDLFYNVISQYNIEEYSNIKSITILNIKHYMPDLGSLINKLKESPGFHDSLQWNLQILRYEIKDDELDQFCNLLDYNYNRVVIKLVDGSYASKNTADQYSQLDLFMKVRS